MPAMRIGGSISSSSFRIRFTAAASSSTINTFMMRMFDQRYPHLEDAP